MCSGIFNCRIKWHEITEFSEDFDLGQGGAKKYLGISQLVLEYDEVNGSFKSSVNAIMDL
jgi:hypothetical protein